MNLLQSLKISRVQLHCERNPVSRQRSKHIDVRYHVIRTVQSTGKVVINYCPTTDMIADVMTKATTKLKLHIKFKSYIFGYK